MHVIVPFAPGGGVDILARHVCRKLGERLGQQFYVENIAGAAGNLGTAQAARAAPDGGTVLFVFGSFVISPSLFVRPGFDPQRDFAPVTLAAKTPTVLVVNPSIPAHTVGELIDYIRATRGKLSFAHGGVGTLAHLAGEQFRLALDLDLVNIPFGGAAPATASVVAGHTLIGFISLPAVDAQVKEGRLRALAVTGNARARALPDVPTMSETGPEAMGTAAKVWHRCRCTKPDGGAPMTQVDDLSRSLITLEQNSTLVVVLEMSQSSRAGWPPELFLALKDDP